MSSLADDGLMLRIHNVVCWLVKEEQPKYSLMYTVDDEIRATTCPVKSLPTVPSHSTRRKVKSLPYCCGCVVADWSMQWSGRQCYRCVTWVVHLHGYSDVTCVRPKSFDWLSDKRLRVWFPSGRVRWNCAPTSWRNPKLDKSVSGWPKRRIELIG